jgi:hypothetical protein
MGIAFITAKAERFQHQRDAAFEEQFGTPNLFSGLPEEILQTYRFKALTAEVPGIGTPVLIFRSEGQVRAFHMNLPIGLALKPDGAELGEMMDQHQTSTIAAQIVELRPISRTFVVAVRGGSGRAE